MNGYVLQPGLNLLRCLRCGAAVLAVHDHDDWHDRMGDKPYNRFFGGQSTEGVHLNALLAAALLAAAAEAQR
jgi:hypothetical protein